MFKLNYKLILFISALISVLTTFAQFAPAVGQEGSTAIHNTDKRIISWAETCAVERGWMNIADTSLGKVSYGVAENAIGASDPAVVSLGDGGSALLTFHTPITDGEGFDFAVFENSFDDYFLELAFVEISSNGVDFVRFPSISKTQYVTQIGSFGTLETDKIHNLAGKYRSQYGTPFDLSELKDCTQVDINNINYVKIIDVVGSINPEYATYDNEGNIINDPYSTAYENGGFDLDAVAVLDMGVSSLFDNQIIFDELTIFPNPARIGDIIHIPSFCKVYDVFGQEVQIVDGSFNTLKWREGVYLINDGERTKRLIVTR